MTERPKCFVISPIGEEGSAIRYKSDTAFNRIVRPVVEACGYDAVRADQISRSGQITIQILQGIVDSALAVADLTDRNPNVFYELALRHATRKPVILMMETGQTIPFDLANQRTIFYNINDLNVAESAKEELAKHIRNVQGGDEGENPISLAMDLMVLKSSGDADQRSIAEVVGLISDLRAMMVEANQRVEYLANRGQVNVAGYRDIFMGPAIRAGKCAEAMLDLITLLNTAKDQLMSENHREVQDAWSVIELAQTQMRDLRSQMMCLFEPSSSASR